MIVSCSVISWEINKFDCLQLPRKTTNVFFFLLYCLNLFSLLLNLTVRYHFLYCSFKIRTHVHRFIIFHMIKYTHIDSSKRWFSFIFDVFLPRIVALFSPGCFLWLIKKAKKPRNKELSKSSERCIAVAIWSQLLYTRLRLFNL